MQPRLQPLLAALGILVSLGAQADKGSGGPSNGLGSGHDRGSARFADFSGTGPASAFEQRAQVLKGGLEFQAAGNGRGHPGTSDAGSAGRSLPGEFFQVQTPSGASTGASLAASQNDATAAFAPWKVTDKDGKPVSSKSALECGTK